MNFLATNIDNMPLLLAIAGVLVLIYIVYQRNFHPLSIYPGPYIASITDLWQVREIIRGEQPYQLAELHFKYGEIVRYGPDKLSITCEDAIDLIYVKNSKVMPKTEYYNAFGQPGNPNLFNMRDNEAHTPRRRQLLKIFSPRAVETYEPLIEKHICQLRSKIRDFVLGECSTSFDMKELLWCFMCDVISELVYGESWGSLSNPEANAALDIHALSLWGAASGSWSMGEPFIKLLIAMVPYPFAYKVFWQNISYAMKMAKVVECRVSELKDGVHADREDLLTKLISESKGKNGIELSTSDIAVESFSFLIAGIHPPASAITLLFYHLLHNPVTMERAAAEVQQHLPQLSVDLNAYANASVEQNLPYLRKCVKESFRLTPGFTMPLARRVTQNEGVFINGHKIPKGTSVAVCNHAFHHNASIWPDDHNVFDPSRWDSPDAKLADLSKLMMHFGAGTRQCIGKSLAMTIIHKVVASLLSEFHFELADLNVQQEAEQGAFRGKLPQLDSVGISDLKGPLMVHASLNERR